MKIYIDENFRCYAESADGLRECESAFFDGKEKRLIRGYRYLPQGEKWVRSDGVTFYGEMIAPIEDPAILQLYDEQEKIRDSVTANSEYIVQKELEKAMENIK